jgi:hypothetical protein
MLRLTLAATGIAALLWSLPAILAAAGCKDCVGAPDLPRVAPGNLPSRRIR